MYRGDFYETDVSGVYIAAPGTTIDPIIRLAIEVAATRQMVISFDFNDVIVAVEPGSNAKLILRDWRRAMSGYLGEHPIIGPRPKSTLSAKELASDARIEAENQRRRAEIDARYRAEEEEKRNRVTARMVDAPEMEFSDREGWLAAEATNRGSSYGAGILDYAERWARMMQLEISEGKTLAEIWESTSFEADLEGMSGFSQGIATHLLTQCWVHGAELRRLHNAYWGSNSTKGTVNPAIFTIGE